jgi:hypothetical protein
VAPSTVTPSKVTWLAALLDWPLALLELFGLLLEQPATPAAASANAISSPAMRADPVERLDTDQLLRLFEYGFNAPG